MQRCPPKRCKAGKSMFTLPHLTHTRSLCLTHTGACRGALPRGAAGSSSRSKGRQINVHSASYASAPGWPCEADLQPCGWAIAKRRSAASAYDFSLYFISGLCVVIVSCVTSCVCASEWFCEANLLLKLPYPSFPLQLKLGLNQWEVQQDIEMRISEAFPVRSG